MSDRPLLSLCMIVRDAEHDLARCLASVVGAVDEIVVVDTGSRDRTKEVARAHGARLLETPWDDDFAAARNVGLEAARGEWILFLDADEVLDPPSPPGLRRLARMPDHVGFYFNVCSPTQASDSMDVAILRMFRASPKVRFRYPLHEQVLEDLVDWARRDGLQISLVDDVRIVHEGYRPEVIADRGKEQRNRRIFEKALHQYPENAYLWYKWADAMRSQPGKGAEALAAAERALELVERMDTADRARVPYFPELLAVCAAARLAQGRVEAANRQLQLHPPNEWRSANYSYVAAHVHESLGNWDTALHWAEDVSALRASPLIVQRAGVRGPLAAALRARLHLRRGAWSEAAQQAAAAAAMDPGMEVAYRLWADALVQCGDTAGAIGILTRGIRAARATAGCSCQLALLLMRTEKRSLAAPLLRRASLEDSMARVALAVFFAEFSVPLSAEEDQDRRALEAVQTQGCESVDPDRPIQRVLAPLLHLSPCLA